MHLAEFAQLDTGQGQKVLLDAQEYFADDHQIAVLEEFIIAQNAPGDAVFNGQHGSIGLMGIMRLLKQGRKGSGWYYLHRCAVKRPGRNFMKGTAYPLNSNALERLRMNTDHGRR